MRTADPPAESVRPLDWARAVTRHPFPVESTKTVKGKTSVLAVAMALVTLAPGRSHRATGWTFYASGPTLQGLAGLGESSVSLVLGQLRAAGFLVLVVRGGGRNRTANTWRLALPEGSLSPVPQSTGDRVGTPVPQSTGDNEGTPVPGTELRDGTPVPEGSNSRALGHDPRESFTKRGSSSSGLLGSGRAREEFANDDEPRDEQRDAVEPITADEVAAIVAASAGRWQQRGVRKYAGEFARMFGRADALRRLNEAARDPSARTPRVAGFSKYAAASAERVETVEGPREPACRTCGLVERVCSRTLGSDHEFEPADEPVDHVEPTPTRRGGRRAAGDPDALGNLVEGVLRP